VTVTVEIVPEGVIFATELVLQMNQRLPSDPDVMLEEVVHADALNVVTTPVGVIRHIRFSWPLLVCSHPVAHRFPSGPKVVSLNCMDCIGTDGANGLDAGKCDTCKQRYDDTECSGATYVMPGSAHENLRSLIFRFG